jgi:hypothetical protein
MSALSEIANWRRSTRVDAGVFAAEVCKSGRA